ncbi:GIY-YIG nuclease family protein [Zhihengliuella sp.]|uniref:GIY-YIG nuclease family protein n=1 Tax=Zhihengliuella sp. TaxID=1954483 RepID=UPI002811932C|nr:HTH domain-containing protein [Zhihengliuella sp.]
MTLHEAINEILLETGRPMTTTEIAAEVNARGAYKKRDGSPVTPFQIHGRTKNYPRLFSRSGSTVSLCAWGDDAAFLCSHATQPDREVGGPITVSAVERPAAVGRLESLLLEERAFRPAGSIDPEVPNEPGLYAIRIHERSSLPEPFAALSQLRGHDLLYVGIARQSLKRRLLGQELRGRGHGTFFRSIGAVLGYRPVAGSLTGRGNTRNYSFPPTDTDAIVHWINQHLLVNWISASTDHEAQELALIRKHRPLLNLQGNPARLGELAALRAECVRIANSPL